MHLITLELGDARDRPHRLPAWPGLRRFGYPRSGSRMHGRPPLARALTWHQAPMSAASALTAGRGMHSAAASEARSTGVSTYVVSVGGRRFTVPADQIRKLRDQLSAACSAAQIFDAGGTIVRGLVSPKLSVTIERNPGRPRNRGRPCSDRTLLQGDKGWTTSMTGDSKSTNDTFETETPNNISGHEESRRETRHTRP